jgi:hypothetical protein
MREKPTKGGHPRSGHTAPSDGVQAGCKQPDGQITRLWSEHVQPLLKKYSAFPKSQITLYQIHPAPKEGRWPSSRTLERDAVDATASCARTESQGGFPVSDCGAQTSDAEAYGEIVWS